MFIPFHYLVDTQAKVRPNALRVGGARSDVTMRWLAWFVSSFDGGDHHLFALAQDDFLFQVNSKQREIRFFMSR